MNSSSLISLSVVRDVLCQLETQIITAVGARYLFKSFSEPYDVFAGNNDIISHNPHIQNAEVSPQGILESPKDNDSWRRQFEKFLLQHEPSEISYLHSNQNIGTEKNGTGEQRRVVNGVAPNEAAAVNTVESSNELFIYDFPFSNMSQFSIPKGYRHLDPAIHYKVNREILDFYCHHILPSIRKEGNNKGGSYESFLLDFSIVKLISRRIHIGMYVAEAKFREAEEIYTQLGKLQKTGEIFQKLTNEAVEKRVLERVYNKSTLLISLLSYDNQHHAITSALSPVNPDPTITPNKSDPPLPITNGTCDTYSISPSPKKDLKDSSLVGESVSSGGPTSTTTRTSLESGRDIETERLPLPPPLLSAKSVVRWFESFIIPSTKNVEVYYLLDRSTKQKNATQFGADI